MLHDIGMIILVVIISLVFNKFFGGKKINPLEKYPMASKCGSIGSNNTSIGCDSLLHIITGDDNTCVGECKTKPDDVVGKLYRAKDSEWPIYMPTKVNGGGYTYMCKWDGGNVSGFGDIYELIERINNGDVIEVNE